MDGAELRNELERHHRDSYGWALACCQRNQTDAENILQTAYLKVLDGKARFDGRSAFKTWLFSVIRRTAIDHRRREVLGRLRLVKHHQGLVHVASGVDDAIYRSEVQTSFQQAIVELPRRQQEVLQLVFYHDLSLAEAAGVMGIGIGSARTHYERGKQRLRRSMAKLGIHDESGLARKGNQTALP